MSTTKISENKQTEQQGYKQIKNKQGVIPQRKLNIIQPSKRFTLYLNQLSWNNLSDIQIMQNLENARIMMRKDAGKVAKSDLVYLIHFLKTKKLLKRIIPKFDRNESKYYEYRFKLGDLDECMLVLKRYLNYEKNRLVEYYTQNRGKYNSMASQFTFLFWDSAFPSKSKQKVSANKTTIYPSSREIDIIEYGRNYLFRISSEAYLKLKDAYIKDGERGFFEQYKILIKEYTSETGVMLPLNIASALYSRLHILVGLNETELTYQSKANDVYIKLLEVPKNLGTYLPTGARINNSAFTFARGIELLAADILKHRIFLTKKAYDYRQKGNLNNKIKDLMQKLKKLKGTVESKNKNVQKYIITNKTYFALMSLLQLASEYGDEGGWAIYKLVDDSINAIISCPDSKCMKVSIKSMSNVLRDGSQFLKLSPMGSIHSSLVLSTTVGLNTKTILNQSSAPFSLFAGYERGYLKREIPGGLPTSIYGLQAGVETQFGNPTIGGYSLSFGPNVYFNFADLMSFSLIAPLFSYDVKTKQFRGPKELLPTFQAMFLGMGYGFPTGSFLLEMNTGMFGKMPIAINGASPYMILISVALSIISTSIESSKISKGVTGGVIANKIMYDIFGRSISALHKIDMFVSEIDYAYKDKDQPPIEPYLAFQKLDYVFRLLYTGESAIALKLCDKGRAQTRGALRGQFRLLADNALIARPFNLRRHESWSPRKAIGERIKKAEERLQSNLDKGISADNLLQVINDYTYLYGKVYGISPLYVNDKDTLNNLLPLLANATRQLSKYHSKLIDQLKNIEIKINSKSKTKGLGGSKNELLKQRKEKLVQNLYQLHLMFIGLKDIRDKSVLIVSHVLKNKEYLKYRPDQIMNMVVYKKFSVAYAHLNESEKATGKFDNSDNLNLISYISGANYANYELNRFKSNFYSSLSNNLTTQFSPAIKELNYYLNKIPVSSGTILLSEYAKSGGKNAFLRNQLENSILFKVIQDLNAIKKQYGENSAIYKLYLRKTVNWVHKYYNVKTVQRRWLRKYLIHNGLGYEGERAPKQLIYSFEQEAEDIHTLLAKRSADLFDTLGDIIKDLKGNKSSITTIRNKAYTTSDYGFGTYNTDIKLSRLLIDLYNNKLDSSQIERKLTWLKELIKINKAEGHQQLVNELKKLASFMDDLRKDPTLRTKSNVSKFVDKNLVYLRFIYYSYAALARAIYIVRMAKQEGRPLNKNELARIKYDANNMMRLYKTAKRVISSKSTKSMNGEILSKLKRMEAVFHTMADNPKSALTLVPKPIGGIYIQSDLDRDVLSVMDLGVVAFESSIEVKNAVSTAVNFYDTPLGYGYTLTSLVNKLNGELKEAKNSRKPLKLFKNPEFGRQIELLERTEKGAQSTIELLKGAKDHCKTDKAKEKIDNMIKSLQDYVKTAKSIMTHIHKAAGDLSQLETGNNVLAELKTIQTLVKKESNKNKTFDATKHGVYDFAYPYKTYYEQYSKGINIIYR